MSSISMSSVSFISLLFFILPPPLTPYPLLLTIIIPIGYAYITRKSLDVNNPNTRLSGATFLLDLPLEALVTQGGVLDGHMIVLEEG
jgi:hypothetical protein